MELFATKCCGGPQLKPVQKEAGQILGGKAHEQVLNTADRDTTQNLYFLNLQWLEATVGK